MRPAFARGFLPGSAHRRSRHSDRRPPAPGDALARGGNAAVSRTAPRAGRTQPAFGKLDGVFLSGNNTRDDIPSHLVVPEAVSPETARLYQRLCPAVGVRGAGRGASGEPLELRGLPRRRCPRPPLDSPRGRRRTPLAPHVTGAAGEADASRRSWLAPACSPGRPRVPGARAAGRPETATAGGIFSGRGDPRGRRSPADQSA